MPRFVDLSVAIDGVTPADPPGLRPTIIYKAHADGALDLVRLFPNLRPDALPNGEGWAVEELRLTSHSGTHLDAPWHYHSTMDDGARAMTIDQVPLDWCQRPGVKLDFRGLPDGYVVTATDIKAELRRIGYELRPLDIVLVNTRAGSVYGQSNYLDAGCGIGRDATLFLTGCGIKIAGTDAWSWDAPFSFTRRLFEETGDASVIWEGHKAGRHAAFCHLEKLTNLDLLPSVGFIVSCFPVKISEASAGWTRAVAIIADQ